MELVLPVPIFDCKKNLNTYFNINLYLLHANEKDKNWFIGD